MTVSINNLRIPSGLVLNESQERGHSFVNCRDEDLLGGKAMLHEVNCAPAGWAWHLEIESRIYGLVDTICAMPMSVVLVWQVY